jgi:hypothetical protein
VNARRRIIHRTVFGALRSVHREWFPTMPFLAAVESLVILDEIITAQLDGKPFRTTTGLARSIGMPRVTLLRRLAYLEAKGVVCRDGQGQIVVSKKRIETAAADRLIEQLVQLITHSATALSELEPPVYNHASAETPNRR